MLDQPLKRLYEFGSFRMDTRDRLLLRDGAALAVTPKAFDILLTLVENRGRTMGKDELLDLVWGEAFVEVGNLNRHISTLRSLLGDNRHKPTFIRTYPKLGYRFEADVREVIEDEEPLVIERRTNYRVAVREVTATTTARRPSRWMIAAASAAVIVIGIAAAWTYQSRGPGAEAHRSLAAANKEAVELYTEGRRLWEDRSGESLHRATILLEQAVAADPQFARAHAALADAYAFDLGNRTKAEDAARRAIELDPGLGEPYATIGFIKTVWEWDISGGESYFKQAIALSPDYATGHQWYAMNLLALGQVTEALAEIKSAVEIAPDALAINADMCQVFYYARQFDQAEQQCKHTLAMDERFLNANIYLYDVYLAKGMNDEALHQFERIEKLAPNYTMFPGAMAELRRTYEDDGLRAYFRKRIDMLKRPVDHHYSMALYHSRLGEKDRVFENLEKAYENREFDFIHFLAEPAFMACCFQDPRFAALQAKFTRNETQSR